MLHPGSRWLLSYQGCFCICSMGGEREHLEGKVHTWETPQEPPTPDSPWERGCSLSTLLLLLYPRCFSPAPGPFALEGSGKRGSGWSPTAGASLGVLLGFWTLSQASPRCSSTGRSCSGRFPSLLRLLRGSCTHNFSAHMRHLLVCCLPEESRTGSFSLVQDSRPLASYWARYSLQLSCRRRAVVKAPCPPSLIDLILRNLGFPARNVLNHHKRITREPGCG